MAKINTRDRNKNIPNKKPNWEYRFECAKVDGKRKCISKCGFKTKKEALIAGSRAYDEYHTCGTVTTESSASFNDLLDLYVKQYAKINCKTSTVIGYQMIIDNHLKPSLGHYYVKSLTTSILQDFINNKYLSGFSKNYLSSMHSLLNMALNYAVEPLNYIKFNPMAYVKLPKFKTERPTTRFLISQEDFNTILNRFPIENPFHIMLMIGYHTGLRINEVTALTWNDIDFDKRTLTVSKSLYNEGTQWFVGTPKTKSSNRTILIGETLLNALKEHKKIQDEVALFNGDNYIVQYLIDGKRILSLPKASNYPSEQLNFVCKKLSGELLTSNSFKYCAKVIHYELGIEFNFHSLRHTHATILIENGANIKDVQNRLGHNQIMTTLQTYTHNTEKMAEDTINIFEKTLSKN